ncbi:MAG: sulfatase-like hydrolase/transferase [Methylotenera sp.]|uniref:sulfatase-like hydrolase/transferase n=1 Tax=Methylotenera sp. TaxID=2051956 RepID=UPI002488E6D8|nr:sulfatase-like hydrolase/transferase [Methylotenera sp.]MDI1308164.1 sulfatase-like hydrolase/transferase [Methylotenera sp.]
MLSPEKKIQNRHRHWLRAGIRFLTYLLAFFLCAIALWVSSNFGEPSLEQVLYHVQFGMEGLVDTDTALIESFLKWCVALPVGLSLLLVFVEYSIALFITHGSTHWLTRPARAANIHAVKIFYSFINLRAPLYTLVAAVTYFCIQFSVTAFVHNQFGKNYFAQHYVYPAKVKVELIKPKNLVLIYVESLEDSYKDPKIFGKNLVASLDHIKGTSFESFKQAPGTGWTIAGITSTQCGLPLKSVSLYDGNNQGENIRSFLPNAVCLGDILHNAGYHNVYMGGDALAFSGKGKFFQDHHYDEVYGREELKGNRKKSEMNYWGLYDDDLFKLVKQKLVELHKGKKPFNLTFTTIDTHGPKGHFSKYCRAHGIKDFPGIVECTSNQVAEFVQFMKVNGYLKNTNVVILGDHLAMENPVSDKLEKIKERHVFNRFISNKPVLKNRDAVLHFDMFPSILELIGFKVEGGKLGLGYSAISKNTDLPLETEYEEMNENLLNQSDEYLELWKQRH